MGDIQTSFRNDLFEQLCSDNKTRLLWDRSAQLAAPRFGKYLLIHSSVYRMAYTHLLLSGHGLAIKRLRWARRRRGKVPRVRRICRLCKSAVEDEAHALFECAGHNDLINHRHDFWQAIKSSSFSASTQQSLTRRLPLDAQLRQALAIGETDSDLATLVGKLAWRVLECFASVEFFIPPRALWEAEITS